MEVQAAGGEYHVYVGLYQVASLERLGVVVGGVAQPDDQLSLGTVQVP